MVKGGRPPIGPVYELRLPPDLRAALEKESKRRKESMADVARRLILNGLRELSSE